MGKKLRTAFIWIALIAVLLLVVTQGRRGIRKDRNPAFEAVPVPNAAAIELIEGGEVVGWRHANGVLQLVDVDDYVWECREPDVSAVRAALANASVLPAVMPIDRDESDSGSWVFWIIIPVLFFLFLLFFLKRSGAATNNIFELRKTKARAVDDESKLRFSDVGGNHSAVELMQDLVDFLRDSTRWKSAGARIPRGILLVGPPGTGKTLLAKAVAGETDASFFYTSATEFVEMFVGVGAARVRDTFETAGKAQPAIIFIDELDAIGRARSSGMGTMHEEREQTLNQLLVLMDGLERFERVVVIAATNRADVLDKALMRPGRFDRIIRLEAPTAEDRLEILKIHMREKPMHEAATAEALAEHVDGLTGAEIETALNEGAIQAVRRCRRENVDRVTVTREDIVRAVGEMRKGNRQFDRLDSVLVESVTQFSEPTGRAVARITTVNGHVIEGDVVWMNGTHIKLRTSEGEVVVSKELAERIEAMEGTETAADGDFMPDPWTQASPDTV